MSNEPESWEVAVREAFAAALSSSMDFLRSTYEGAIAERDQLRKRVTYLEQRLEEEQKARKEGTP